MTSTMANPTWVYPPPGEATPPIAQTGDFGPLNKYDTIVMDWSPDTRPDIDVTCLAQSNVESAFDISHLAGPPVSWQLIFTAPQSSENDLVYCHLNFKNSDNDNTVTWQYTNQVGAANVTYSASGTKTSRPSSSASLTSSTRTNSSTASAPPTASPTATAKTLSTGAKAGIGLGVTFGALLIAIIVWLLLLLRKQRRRHAVYPAGVVEAGHGQEKQFLHEVYTQPTELETEVNRTELR